MNSETDGAKSLRFFLRDNTAGSHRQLDARFSLLDLSLLEDYRSFLTASAAALIPLEHLLEASGVADIFPDWPQRSRRASLIKDCENMSAEISTFDLMRAHFSPDEMAGVVYVLEGSRLGAKLLLKQVQHSAAQNYLSHGVSEKLWPSFVDQLEALHVDRDEVARGAKFAFSVFEKAAILHVPEMIMSAAE
ncbi:MAG: biliverdin-producing heme oxygenase [Pseudomonadota bacterium]